MKFGFKLFGLIVGISAVITLTFFLINSPYKCIIPFEPITWIRIPEIIMGIGATLILGKMIFNEIKEKKKK